MEKYKGNRGIDEAIMGWVNDYLLFYLFYLWNELFI